MRRALMHQSGRGLAVTNGEVAHALILRCRSVRERAAAIIGNGRFKFMFIIGRIMYAFHLRTTTC